MNKIHKLCKMYKTLKGSRQNWDDHWRQVAQYVAPNKDDVYDYLYRAKGEERHLRLYDGSPEHFNELLASALHSMLTNPSQQWFDLSTGNEDIDKDPEVKAYLQKLVTHMHNLLNNSNFNTEIHEVYLDLGAFGTAALRVMEDEDYVFRFHARPIYEHYIMENHLGEVDGVFTPVRMTLRQIIQKFGEDFLQEDCFKGHSRETLEKREYTVIHAIIPREDAKAYGVDAKSKPYASYHFLEKEAVMLKESGFDSLPYIITRWIKASGETYGRSPSMKALPDIRMLQAVMRDTIRSAQKVTDPPLMVPDDGMLNPTDTRPGGINYYRAGTPDRIFPLETRGQPRIGYDVIDDLRVRISKHYFIDQLQLRESDRMTATEVMQRTDEQLRLLGPILGRQHFELLQPLVARMLSIMIKRREMPEDMPEVLKDIVPQVKFVSQIARAQKIAEAQNINRMLEQVLPVLQVDPNASIVLDVEQLIRFSADKHDLPEALIRRPEEIQQIQQQQAEQQQAMMEAQLAQQGADATQKLAQAERSRRE